MPEIIGSYLDESGDHSLTRIDSQYPVFVLGGVVIDADYADSGDSRGRLVADRRGRGFDAALQLAWAALEVGGTAYLSPSVIKQRIAVLYLRDNKSRIARLVVLPRE